MLIILYMLIHLLIKKIPAPRAPFRINPDHTLLDKKFFLILSYHCLEKFAHQCWLYMTLHIQYVVSHYLCFIVEIHKVTSLLQFTSLGLSCDLHSYYPIKAFRVLTVSQKFENFPHSFYSQKRKNLFFFTPFV